MSTGIETRECYMLLTNISKKNNIRDLIFLAKAFNLIPIVVNMLNTKTYIQQIFDTNMIQAYMYFDHMDEAQSFLSSLKVTIIGIEIMSESISVCEFPFNIFPSIAFMPGNEGTGLSAKQKSACDKFIYIPQFGSGTASLNVNTATSIIVHRYQLSLSV